MDPAIVTEGLTRRFGHRLAVDHISLTIGVREIFGVIGPDGAGKTTFFRMLATVLEPTGGSARVAGADVTSAPEAVKARIGYMPQAFALYPDLTVLENLRFVADVYAVPRSVLSERAERLLSSSRMGPFRHRLAEHLSGGMRQKLALAATLIHQPEVLLLDEPTTGVDPVSRREFWQILYDLNQQGMTVVVATPYMDEAERCARVALLHQGRTLTVDTPAGVRARMRGTVLEVTATPRRAALTAARALPGVMGGTVFGANLHLVVSGPDLADELRAGLERRGIAVGAIRPIEPSLEDVFISLMSQRADDAR
ncbi:MAG: ABC transporter ATP-binding protein [Armatimonadota bacterium]|nr:ABC transporter ATP-binding protein [Armatimonadota bacterium]